MDSHPSLSKCGGAVAGTFAGLIRKRGEEHSNIIYKTQQVRHTPPVDLYLHRQVILAITELLFTHEDTHIRDTERGEKAERVGE